MGVIRRRNEKQNLADIPTLITEEGIDSKYFQIFGMPEELPTGKSSFIVGGSPFLKSGVKLKIEIIDSQGGVVYTEPVYGYRDGVNRRVSIEIYEPKQVGEAILTLLGEIDPAKSDVPIPTEWQGVYNVKYTRRLSINPTLLNVQPIRFHKQPFVNIVPLTNAYKEYIQQPEETRILTAELASSITTGTSAQTTDVVTQEQSYPAEDQDEKSFDFMSLYNSAAFRQSSFSNFRMPFTFQFNSPATGNANLIVSSGSLDDGMIGKDIIINDPQVDTTSPDIPTTYTVPTQYSSSIIDITNDTTLNLAKAFYVTGDDGSTKYPVNLSADQSFTCSFSPVPTEQDSVINYFDLADIRLSRLRTFSGDVKYVRVFAISQGSQTEQQFDFLGEFPLESQELLFDYDNIKSGRTGFFFNQTKIDNYWNAYGGTRSSNLTDSFAQTGSFIRYSMDISGSNADLNQEIMAQTSHSFSLSKNVPYELSFKVYGSRTPKTTSAGEENKARIDFLISGSDFKPNHEFGGTYGRRILSVDFDDSDEYPELRDLQSYDWNKTYLSGMFIPLTSGVGKLQIRASSGRWHVADVSLRPAADTNFSPEVARIFSEMPPSRNRPETVKFLLEFVNNDGKKADAVIISPDVVFPGANFAIQGDNNVLSGSLFISNAIGQGIEMAGVGSAFLRTIGWEGFTSASAGTGNGGFFLYSGSGVLPDSGEDYMGAGLEIHDGQSGASERYFQFKTQHGASSESIFRVKTDDYLFGISGSGAVESYISGADGNLEISSSNFYLSRDGSLNAGVGNLTLDTSGNVAMAGEVTATSGKIGDWTISSGNIVGANITMDADSSRIYKTDSNGNLDGYYMDFTPGSNYYVRFGTDFAVSSSGTLIASGAKIEGVITASEGYIANWTIGPNTVSKLTSAKYSGLSSAGDTRFFAGADNLTSGTGSAVFNVKADGQVTASSGIIGGWILNPSPEELRSPSNRILLSGRASAERMTVKNSSDNDVIKIGEISSDTSDQYGIKVYDGTGVSDDNIGTGTVVMLGDLGNKIGGWEITDTQIRSIPNEGLGGQYDIVGGEDGLILSNVGRMNSAGYVPNQKGWNIDTVTNGFAEFQNIVVRGTLKTAVFQKDSVNVVGGTLRVANAAKLQALRSGSTVLSGSVSMSATTTTASVDNVSGFEAGEILLAKKIGGTGFQTEYMLVTGSKRWSTDDPNVTGSSVSNDTDGISGEIYLGRAYGALTGGDVSGSSNITLTDGAFTSTTISGNYSQSIFDVDDASDLAAQDFLKIEHPSNGNFEFVKITSISSDTLTVRRKAWFPLDINLGATELTSGVGWPDNSKIYKLVDRLFSAQLNNVVSVGQSYEEGQVFASTGKFTEWISSGWIDLDANPTSPYTPMIQIMERTGSGVYDYVLRTQLGDLSGLSSGYLYGDENPGFGLYTENGFFSGAITAQTGSFAGIVHVATTQGGLETGQRISIGREVSGTNDGFYINNNNYWFTSAEFRLGDGSNYLWISGSQASPASSFKIKTEDLSINTEKFILSSSLNNGTIKLGGVSPNYASALTSVTNTGIYMDGTGVFRVGETVSTGDNFIYFNGSTIQLKSTELYITAGTMTIQANSSEQFFEVGGLSSAIDTADSSTGVYIDSAGGFLAKTGTSGSGYVQVTGSNVNIKTGNFDLDATGLKVVGGTTSYIQVGSLTGMNDYSNTGVYINQSGQFHARQGSAGGLKLDNSKMEITSSVFDINTTNLKINSEGYGRIYGGAAEDLATGDGFYISGSGDIRFGTATNATASKYIYFSSNDGLKIETPSASINYAGYFEAQDADIAGNITATGGEIGGFQISTTQLKSSDSEIVIDSSNTSIILGDEDGRQTKVALGTLTPTASIAGGTEYVQNSSHLSASVATGSMINEYNTGTATTTRLSHYYFNNTKAIASGSTSNTNSIDGDGGKNWSVKFTLTGALRTYQVTSAYIQNFESVTPSLIDIEGSATVTYGVSVVSSSGVVLAHSSQDKSYSTYNLSETSNGENLLVGSSTSSPTAYQYGSYHGRSDSYTFVSNFALTHDSDVYFEVTQSLKNNTFRNKFYAGLGFGDWLYLGGPYQGETRTQATATYTSLRPNSNLTEVLTKGIQTVYDVHSTDDDEAKFFRVDFDNVSAGEYFIQSAGLWYHRSTFYCSDDIYAFYSSDLRLKKNIKLIESPIEKLKKLKGISFEWNDIKSRPKDFHNKRELGVIAQDVLPVLPEIVRKRNDGYYAIKYEQLIPVLVEAIKEQQTQIEYLIEHSHEPQNYKAKCDEMEERILKLEKKLEVT